LDYVIFQQKVPAKERIDQYIKSSELLSDFVYPDVEKISGDEKVRYIGADIIPVEADFITMPRKSFRCSTNIF